MNIGLYDIDLWHGRKAMPNLELMKMFNYHYQNNDKVKIMTTNELEGRFDKIIYFCDSDNFIIPKNLVLTGKKKEFYGYGFFKSFYPLDDIYKDVPPDYLCYEPYTEKFSKHLYNTFKKSSLIRFENMDMSDFKKEKKTIIIADHDFIYMENAAAFLKEYQNYTINFSHGLNFKDEKTLLEFYPYMSIIYRRFYINYHFSEEIFKKFFNERVIFNWNEPFENESQEQQIIRIILMILYYKINNTKITIEHVRTKNPLLKYIQSWGKDYNQLSYFKYYERNKDAINLANSAESNIRLLLKSNPLKMKSSDIDFSGIL